MPLKPRELSFLRLLGSLLPSKRRPDFRPILDNPRRILLVKPSERLGNVVLMNSAIGSVYSAHPDISIDLLLPETFADIMAGDRRINEIIRVGKKEYILKPFKLMKLIGSLKGRHYDLAIDCSDVNSHSLTAAAYTLLSRPVISAGWKMGDRPVFDIEIPRYDEVIPVKDMIPRLISGIFGRDLSGDPYFESRSSRSLVQEPVVGINCGGRGSKRWPLENFIELGRRLSLQGIRSEFILGPAEGSMRSELRKNLAENSCLRDEMPAVKLKEVIARYALFVSSDTGPMHLAWTQRVPTIAIFLDSEIEKFKPLSSGSVALDGKVGVSVDRVFQLVMEALNQKIDSRVPGVKR